MARPRLPIGSSGVINLKELPSGKWRARCRYRFKDGRFRQVERVAASKAKAEVAIKDALSDLAKTQANGAMKPSMRLSLLADKYMQHQREERSNGTVQVYESVIDRHIKPRIGELTIGEAQPAQLQAFVDAVVKDGGPGAAKTCRSVLSGMMSMAVMNGAVEHNPVMELDGIKLHGPIGSEAIPLDRLHEFVDKVKSDEALRMYDEADLYMFMLGTGFRIGEACGLCWDAVDFEKSTIDMRQITKRVKGKGMVLQDFGKTEKSSRTIKVPSYVMELLERRRKSHRPNAYGLVFTTPLGEILDQSLVLRHMRAQREYLGFPRLTSHSFRKTVATILDRRGMSARAIADYLGHSDPALTQKVYMAPHRRNAEAAKQLDSEYSFLK